MYLPGSACTCFTIYNIQSIGSVSYVHPPVLATYSSGGSTGGGGGGGGGGLRGAVAPPPSSSHAQKNDTTADAVSKAKRSDLPYLLLST